MDNKTKIMFFTCVGHFFCHFYELIFPALAVPLMISLKMNLPDVLKLSFFMYLLYGLGALPWGIISDHYGNRMSLIIFFIGTGMGAIMTALSNSGLSIMLSLAAIGFFSSIYHPAGMGLISLGVKNRGMALGINGMAGNLGLATAPFAAGLLNWMVGWKVTYFLIGSFSIFWGIILSSKKIDETPVHDNENGTLAKYNNNHLKCFLILCAVMTLAGLVYRANSVVLPAYLEFKAGFLWGLFQNTNFADIEGTKTMAATLLASSIFIVGIFGQLAGGRLADKYNLGWLYLIFHGLSLPFLILMGILNEQLLVISAAIYILFALGVQPIENSLLARFTPGRWRSAGYGIKFILAFGVGSTAVYFVGWIKNIWSLSVVYFFSGGIVILMLICIAYLIRSSHAAIGNNMG